jgi:hypothetical protein
MGTISAGRHRPATSREGAAGRVRLNELILQALALRYVVFRFACVTQVEGNRAINLLQA